MQGDFGTWILGCEVFPTGRDKRDGKRAQEMLALSGVVEIKGVFAHLLSYHA